MEVTKELIFEHILGLELKFDNLVNNDIAELKTDVAELKTDVSGLKTDVAELKADVAELKTDVSGLKTDVSGLKTDVSELKTRMTSVENELSEVKESQRKTNYILENVIDKNIKLLAEAHMDLYRRQEQFSEEKGDVEMIKIRLTRIEGALIKNGILNG